MIAVRHCDTHPQHLFVGPNMGFHLLFVLKRRGHYDPYGEYHHHHHRHHRHEHPERPHHPGWPWGLSSGLLNSGIFVVDMLRASGIDAEMVQVEDGNGIDREIAERRPNVVIIESLFVTPEKVAELAALHHHVRFLVRTHSELPFMANEGVASLWLHEYLKTPHVSLAPNTARCRSAMNVMARAWFPHWDETTISHRVLYLPNYYPLPNALPRVPSHFGVINIGCFGAIRPMKNQFAQAVAAIEVAHRLRKRLRFHVNGSRIEFKGDNIAKNLVNLFAETANCELVPHEWLPRPEFLDLVRHMDLGMQVSFSETFNIVTADFVTENIPVVASEEIDWLPVQHRTSPTDIAAMVRTSLSALSNTNVGANRNGLLHYNERARAQWLNAFGHAPPHGWNEETGSFAAKPVITSHRK